MATIMQKLEYRKQLVLGIEEFNKPSGEDLSKRLYKDTLPTSTNGDLRLIGAWLASRRGVDQAMLFSGWPSRGHSYRLVDVYGSQLLVKVINSQDFQNGVEEVAK